MFEDRLQPWQQLSSAPLLDHPWCALIEDHVRLPSGKQITWWSFKTTNDFVSVLCFNDNDQLLVAYQYNHPPRRIIDELPGGGREPTDGSIAETARRELLEEIGLYAHHITVIGSFLPNNRRSASTCYVCVATHLEQRTATPEDTEDIAYQWVDSSAIDRAIREGALINGMLLAAWSIYRSQEGAPYIKP
jgi:8-oxo-dGTP pyrophosphatase MutT (NUDIX family)